MFIIVRVFVSLENLFTRLPLSARDALDEIASQDLFWSPGRILRQWSLGATRVASSQREASRPSYGPLERVNLPRGSLAELTAQAFASISDERFEERAEQLDMARDVADTLQGGGTLIVEAGTGTGKSLAYLVPAALWALKTGNTVIVSTHTINLQQQLESKDVEFARRLIAGVSPEAAEALKSTVVKGRDNYLCQEKVDRELGRVTDWQDPLLLARAAVWRSTTERGDRAELRLPTPMLQQWEQLTARDTPCLSDPGCQYVTNGACFLSRIQREAASSHIVIANHALLVRSLVTGSVTLPDSAVVIVDESHALEGVATDQLSLEMNEPWMLHMIQRGVEGPDSLVQVAERAGLRTAPQRLKQTAAQAEVPLQGLFDQIGSFASEYADHQRGNEDRVILSQATRNTEAWSDLELLWEDTHALLGQLAEDVEAIVKDSSSAAIGKHGEEERALQSLTIEARNLLDELSDRRQHLNRAMTEYSYDDVDWVAREHRKSGLTSVHTAPLSIATHLQPLWQERHAAVLTGATLATNEQDHDAFSYLRDRLGIRDAAEAQYGSPFDYARRCRIYIPADSLDANDPEHHDSVAHAVKTLSIVAGGRTMVLFRSYSAMDQVAKRIGQDLEQAGLVLLRQGRDGAPAAIVDALRRDPKSVVFGVAALWTGVDIPGDALSLLIVPRLPFAPPNDPVLKARGEQYRNEFLEFSLPAAVLQFRQGMGRLIRTQSDIGAAVILDGRVTRKRYGPHFLDALPPAPVIRMPIAEVANDLRDFLPPIGQSR